MGERLLRPAVAAVGDHDVDLRKQLGEGDEARQARVAGQSLGERRGGPVRDAAGRGHDEQVLVSERGEGRHEQPVRIGRDRALRDEDDAVSVVQLRPPARRLEAAVARPERTNEVHLAFEVAARVLAAGHRALEVQVRRAERLHEAQAQARQADAGPRPLVVLGDRAEDEATVDRVQQPVAHPAERAAQRHQAHADRGGVAAVGRQDAVAKRRPRGPAELVDPAGGHEHRIGDDGVGREVGQDRLAVAERTLGGIDEPTHEPLTDLRDAGQPGQLGEYLVGAETAEVVAGDDRAVDRSGGLDVAGERASCVPADLMPTVDQRRRQRERRRDVPRGRGRREQEARQWTSSSAGSVHHRTRRCEWDRRPFDTAFGGPGHARRNSSRPRPRRRMRGA